MQREPIILIVEDELLIAEHISRILKSAGFINNTIAVNVDEAIELINQQKPHIVLTDIMFGASKTGIDLGELLYGKYKIPFIYITSHSSADMLAKAKYTHPNAYLIKPFKKEDLLVAIELALFSAELTAKTINEKSLVIKDGHVMAQIPFADILYLEADGNYTFLHTSNGKKRLIRTVITELYQQLANDSFLKIHRSYVVNKKAVTAYKATQIYINKITLPVGRTFKEQLDGVFK